MIGYLKGDILDIEKESLILDVNGVGYLLSCPASFLKSKSIGDEIGVFVITEFRQDHISLTGFPDKSYKNCYKLLTSIPGVGGKVALAILSIYSPSEIAHANNLQDKSIFQSVSGVGPKLATRIITELKGKDFDLTMEITKQGSNKNIVTSNVNDAVSALANLGYNRNDIYKIIAEIETASEMKIEQLIKEVLKKI